MAMMSDPIPGPVLIRRLCRSDRGDARSGISLATGWPLATGQVFGTFGWDRAGCNVVPAILQDGPKHGFKPSS